jgi:hypothetical protein
MNFFFVSGRRQIMSLQIMGWALKTMFFSGPSKSCRWAFHSHANAGPLHDQSDRERLRTSPFILWNKIRPVLIPPIGGRQQNRTARNSPAKCSSSSSSLAAVVCHCQSTTLSHSRRGGGTPQFATLPRLVTNPGPP